MSSLFKPVAALRAALLITGSSYFMYAVGMVVGAIIARQLGPDVYGQYAYIVWISGVFVLLANNGLTVTSIRFVSEALGRDAQDEAKAVHGWLLRRQFLSIVATSLVLVAAATWLLPAGWQLGSSVFIGLVLVVGVCKALYVFQISVGKGHGRYGVEAYSVIGLSIANFIGVLLLVWAQAGLLAYCLFFVALSVGYLAVSAILLRHYAIAPNSQALGAVLLSRVKPHLIWSIVLTLVITLSNKTVETWMLNHFTSAAQVGFFVIAATLTRGGVDLVSSGLNTVLMPMMAHGFGAGGLERVASLLRDGMRYFQFLGLLIAGVGWFWAQPIVHLLYGADYLPAAFAFQVLVLVAGVTLTEGAVGALLTTTDNQRLRVAFSSVALVASVVAAFVFIPRYGLNGALASHAVSQAVLLSAGLVLIQRLGRTNVPWAKLMRLFICAGLAGVFSWLVTLVLPNHLGKVSAGFAYAFTYLLATRQLGCWLPKDGRIVSSLFSQSSQRAIPVDRLVRWYFR